MGRLQTWGAAARRSPSFWVVAAVVVLALVGGGVVLATRSTRPPGPGAPAASTRAVALGRLGPLRARAANPYLTPQVGPPGRRGLAGPLDAGLPEPGGRRTSASP